MSKLKPIAARIRSSVSNPKDRTESQILADNFNELIARMQAETTHISLTTPSECMSADSSSSGLSSAFMAAWLNKLIVDIPTIKHLGKPKAKL